jgi:predicted PurR-regulated permease PerM
VVYGVLGSNLIQAAIAVIGFWIAGVPGALVLGMMAFFLTLIPMACNVLWMPAVIWLVAEGNIGRAIFLGVWSAINFGVLESVLRAWLVGRSSEMPLILLLFGMLGGLVAFGLLGLLIGPTLLALGFSLVSEWSAGPAPAADKQPAAERKPVDAPAR